MTLAELRKAVENLGTYRSEPPELASEMAILNNASKILAVLEAAENLAYWYRLELVEQDLSTPSTLAKYYQAKEKLEGL